MKALKLIPIVGAMLTLASTAQAAGVIFNTGNQATATIALGLNDLGSLNTRTGSVASNAGATGIAYKFADGSFRDATAPGCLCEGWGVSVNNTTSGFANVAGGNGGLTHISNTFSSSAATVVNALSALPGLSVTHAVTAATRAPGALFEMKVSIKNETAAAMNNVKYVRVMDWDVPPTEFREYVTIRGTGTTTLLELSHDDGFESSNPLAATGAITPGTTNTDFTDVGATDHGAYFRFNFGTLAAGTSYNFSIFYGAAADEAGALAAIAAESIELFSLGQSGLGGSVNNDGVTYMFGFKGVGGRPIFDTPEPGALALVGLGLFAAGMARRRKQA